MNGSRNMTHGTKVAQTHPYGNIRLLTVQVHAVIGEGWLARAARWARG